MNGEISPILFWGLIGLLAALLIAAAVFFIVWRLRRRKSAAGEPETVPEPQPQPEPDPPAFLQVGKLHAQGARQGQQDCFSVSPEDLWESHGLLAVVADGMGGLEDGDQVSQTAVSAVVQSFLTSPRRRIPSAGCSLFCRAPTRPSITCWVPPASASAAPPSWRDCSCRISFILSRWATAVSACSGNGSLVQLNREHIYRRELELRAVNGEGTLDEAASPSQSVRTHQLSGNGADPVGRRPRRARPGTARRPFRAHERRRLQRAHQRGAVPGPVPDAQEAADAIGQMVESRAWPGQDNYTAVILQCGSTQQTR